MASRKIRIRAKAKKKKAVAKKAPIKKTKKTVKKKASSKKKLTKKQVKQASPAWTAKDWKNYFVSVAEQIGDSADAPFSIRSWDTPGRADVILYVDVRDVHFDETQRALEDASLDYLQRAGYWVSWLFSGKILPPGSPTLSAVSDTIETFPTKNVDIAAEGASIVSSRAKKKMNISLVRLRFHWNEYGEQPERLQ